MKKIITDINNNIYFKEHKIKLKKIKKYIENNVIRIYKDEEITNFIGLGAAITESSAYNYSLLNDNLKKELIKDYYSASGLNYELGRISIGSCDFSLSSYSYSNKKDLSDFSIDKDNKYIIPMLNDIYKYKKLDLVASPWSPPSFMKDNKMLTLGGKLKKKYYSLYATYLRNFIQSYQTLGFNIKYLTMQNEVFARQMWESCIFTLDEQKDFIYNYLIKEINDLDTKILLFDHNKEDIYNIFKYLYEENDKIAGLAFHYYSGSHFNNIKLIRKHYKDTLLINSEACLGYSKYNEKEWNNDAIYYLIDIINDFNNGANAYLDWNILLDYNGGYNHKKNYCKSPIILNEDKSNYIKTPIYYFLHHIALIKKNSMIIDYSSYNKDILILASKKDNEFVINILNPLDKEVNYNLIIDDKYINDTVKPKSIVSYII